MSDWSNDALCRGKHQDLWFPPSLAEDRTAPEREYYEIAKMVCEHCPVQTECGSFGSEEEFGVWGMSTPSERKNDDYPSLPEYSLIPRYLDKVPEHQSDIRVDVNVLRTLLKRYSNKR